MDKKLRSEAIKQALLARGWAQKDLARELQVTPQAVTNWLKGSDFPRPDKLLKLAMTLGLSFSELVERNDAHNQPVIAFRRKAGTKTTDAHILKAVGMGRLLQPLVAFLPKASALRVQIASPSMQYDALQATALEVRKRLGLGELSALEYTHLIDQFVSNGAVIVPVLWGTQQNHKNALHILLPSEQTTFVFLNLDTWREDFKFWMAHELAHVYTPQLAGKDEGEDFADAFAGALLFPGAAAAAAYAEASKARTAAAQITILQKHADTFGISLFSVFAEVTKYLEASQLAPLRCKALEIHKARTHGRGQLVSESLFNPLPPEPSEYLAAAQNVFRSPFFVALRQMIREQGTGPGYLQQIMDISLADADTLHRELSR